MNESTPDNFPAFGFLFFMGLGALVILLRWLSGHYKNEGEIIKSTYTVYPDPKGYYSDGKGIHRLPDLSDQEVNYYNASLNAQAQAAYFNTNHTYNLDKFNYNRCNPYYPIGSYEQQWPSKDIGSSLTAVKPIRTKLSDGNVIDI